MVDERACRLLVQPGELDAQALRLHGKHYLQLSDAEAGAVWDAIEDNAKASAVRDAIEDNKERSMHPDQPEGSEH